MTNATLVNVCLMSAGATLGTGLLSGAAHAGNREDDLYLPYALTCFGGTIVFLALAALYGAATLDEAMRALHWHIAGIALFLPSIVWMFVRLSRAPSGSRQVVVLAVGAALSIVLNSLWPPSLHFDAIAAAPPSLAGVPGRHLVFIGRGGWISATYHAWLLVPIWFSFVNGRFMWRGGRRLLGGVALGTSAVFLFANVLATRADFAGGTPAYMGGVPLLFSIIMLLGLTMGLAQRHQRLALLAGAVELRSAYEQIQAEMARREQLEERFAETQRMESLGRMASGVAHDFNNVLTVVGGHAGLLLNRLAPGSPEHTGAETIVGAADRGAALTRQLLAFARRQQLAPVEIDADRTLGEMRDLLGSLAGRRTQLVFELGAKGGSILADPSQFTQVIMNLVANARDAMPDGGRLVIATTRIDPSAPGACACEGQLDRGHVLITVSDSGSGIDAATLPRIFEPFFTTKGPAEGTGLGLATVHGIVSQSGGHIAVTSRPGAGTTFRICWPATGVTTTAAQ